tara:strand:+ start:57 stop:743 length:687 start_codon:yes stop_codon:yes gene_type:complete
MKKYILLISLIVITFNSKAQNNEKENNGSKAMAYASATGKTGFTGMFYNRARPVDGNFYIFDKWNNDAVVHKLSGDKFLIRNVNFNLKSTSFDAKIINSEDVYSFTFNNIEKIVIKNKTYKNFNNKIYEIIHDDSQHKLMKGFELKLIKGSTNPMVNRPNDKYVRVEKYYMMIDRNISVVKLKKKSIYKTLGLGKQKISKLDAFIKKNSISLSKEEGWIKCLEFLKNI